MAVPHMMSFVGFDAVAAVVLDLDEQRAAAAADGSAFDHIQSAFLHGNISVDALDSVRNHKHQRAAADVGRFDHIQSVFLDSNMAVGALRKVGNHNLDLDIVGDADDIRNSPVPV